VTLTPSPRGSGVTTDEIDVVRFLLTVQGGRRAALRTPAITRGFRHVSTTSWPGLRVDRYLAPATRVVTVTPSVATVSGR
jgi:hypothetical protein